MGKKDKDFKFVVGSTDLHRSNVWSVKIRKNDIYIMDNHGKDHKISLHASGICHSALTTETSRKFHMTPQQRRSNEWLIDIEKLHAAEVYNIIVPHHQLKNFSNEEPTPESALWIPAPLNPLSVVITFFKTAPQVNEINFYATHTIHPLHTVRLASGEGLAVVYYYTASLNNLIDKAASFLRNYVKSNPPPQRQMRLTSGFVNVSDTTGKQYHIDYFLDDLNSQ